MSGQVGCIQIFESEIQQIANATLNSPRMETGGELLGLWSHGDNPTVVLAAQVTVMFAGLPAPGSKRTATTFELDVHNHMELQRIAWEQFGVQVIGLWHSHHQLSLHELSSGDVRRTKGYSVRHQRPRYGEILAYLVDDDQKESWRRKSGNLKVELRPYVYDNAASGRAIPTNIRILPGVSPFRRALANLDLTPELRTVVGAGRAKRVPYRLANFSSEEPIGSPALGKGLSAPESASADLFGTAAPMHPPAHSDDVLDGREKSANHDVVNTGPPDQPSERLGTSPTAGPTDTNGPAPSPWPLSEIEPALGPFAHELGDRVVMHWEGEGLLLTIPGINVNKHLRVRITDVRRATALITAYYIENEEQKCLFESRTADQANLPTFLPHCLSDLGYRDPIYPSSDPR